MTASRKHKQEASRRPVIGKAVEALRQEDLCKKQHKVRATNVISPSIVTAVVLVEGGMSNLSFLGTFGSISRLQVVMAVICAEKQHVIDDEHPASFNQLDCCQITAASLTTKKPLNIHKGPPGPLWSFDGSPLKTAKPQRNGKKNAMKDTM